MRLDLQAPFGEPVVALTTLLGFMAAIAALRIGSCLEWVNADKIAAMATRCEISPGAVSLEVSADTAAFVAIEAVGLGVTLPAVVVRFSGYSAVIPDPVAVMVRGDTFAFMA